MKKLTSVYYSFCRFDSTVDKDFVDPHRDSSHKIKDADKE